MNCKACQSALPDLLLDSGSEQAENVAARAHVANCLACAQELRSLEATFALLDDWRAPEVSPYFDQKLAVLLREEQAAPAAGWFEQLKTRLLLNTNRQFRPALAVALAAVLIVGGGSFSLSNSLHPAKVEVSATVNDLQNLDGNEQTLQQMDQLLQDDSSSDEKPVAPPS